MAKRRSPSKSQESRASAHQESSVDAVVEFRGAEKSYAYVEEVDGALTPGSVLYANFYCEHLGTQELVEGQIVPTDDGGAVLRVGDPSVKNRRLHIVRDVKANLIFTKTALENVVPWLSARLDEMRKNEETKSE